MGSADWHARRFTSFIATFAQPRGVDELRFEVLLWEQLQLLHEATGGRLPCRTFAAWLGERGWVRHFTHAASPGTTSRVIEPGAIRAAVTLPLQAPAAPGMVSTGFSLPPPG